MSVPRVSLRPIHLYTNISGSVVGNSKSSNLPVSFEGGNYPREEMTHSDKPIRFDLLPTQ